MGNTRDARRTDVTGQIVGAAFALFAERGFAATSMVDIAARSGVPRRTLYRYFATKEDVALAYQDTIRDDLVRRLSARPAAEGAVDALVATLHGFVAALDVAQARTLSDLLVHNPSLRARNLEKYGEIEAAFARVLVERAAGDPAPLNPLAAHVTAAAVVAAWRTANDVWLGGGRAGHPVRPTEAAFAVLRRLGDRPGA